MAGNIEALKWIIIPPQDMGRIVGEDKTEVTPQGKDWLLSNRRSWAEINTHLQGKLKSLQGCFGNSNPKDLEVQRHYGLKESVGDNLSLFLAYVDLVDEQRLLKEAYLKKAEEARKAYEKEKDGIDTRRLSRVHKMKKKAEAYTRYREEIEKYSQKSQEYEHVENFILKKAVFDFFSWQGNSTETGEPLVIQNFAKMFNDARERFYDPSNSASDNFKQRKPIEYFLDSLASFLQRTEDQNLFLQYSYRQSPEIILDSADCLVLENMLTFTLIPESMRFPLETQKKLHILGKGYLSFLKKRCSAKQTNDESPHLSLLHDLIVTSCNNGRPDVIERLSQYIDRIFTDWLNSNNAKEEIKTFAERCLILYKPIDPGLAYFSQKYQNPDMVIGDTERQQTKEKFVKIPEFRNILTFRLMSGLLAFLVDDEKQSQILFGRNPVIRQVADTLRMNLNKLFMAKNIITNSPPYMHLIDQHQRASCFYSWLIRTHLSLGILVLPSNDKRYQLGKKLTREEMAHLDYYNLFGQLRTSDTNKIAILSSYVSQQKENQSMMGLVDFLRLYKTAFWNEEFSESIETENDFLWEEVLNNSEWFISPRGDRFHSKDDPQLSQRAIESITFRVDKNHPRDHQVVLKVKGIDELLEFWLDTKRNLLGPDRVNLIIDPHFRQVLINLLLKRLYFITSGLLSEEQKGLQFRDKETGKLILFYRRPYYAHLFSTEFRRIHLESRSAVFHAKEILEKYGIDIYAENRRRRALGTVKPNEYITYVDEVSSDIRGLVLIPNDLTFKPELINLPIS